MQIRIDIRDKIARLLDEDSTIVCDNSDYTIQFSFDAEWDGYDNKVVHFNFLQGDTKKFVEVALDGSVCNIPILSNTKSVEVGVYAGELHTTTPCLIKCRKSILCDTAEEMAEPFKNLYENLMGEIAEVKKGTIPTMDSVNVWELEAGAYYVNNTVFYATPYPPVYLNSVEMQSEKGLLYVHIDISSNTTRNFYLFANGNIYFGNSMPNAGAADGFGSISSVAAAIKNEIATDRVDGIPTKNAVYNYGENIKTELLTDIGNKADKTEVDTALSRKVNKSDILTDVITDEVYTDTQFYNANAINSLASIFDEDFVMKDTFNTIIGEIANTFQTKVNKTDVLSNLDLDAQPEDIYNAIVINSITQQINETFATKAYVDTVIGGIENGSY